ncbi:MAG: hypothetical protein GY727_14700 [Gammaproteobacteria bacterium]|nr:hypothetical protein [Gammaproteobacteria bacterium]
MNQVGSSHPPAALPFEKAPPDRASRATTSKWRTALAVMFNPGGLNQEQLSAVKWSLVLLIPGLAFSLFFMQTGLDQMKVGYLDGTETFLLTMLGLLYGTVGVTLVSLVAWAGTRVFGGKTTMTNAIRLLALAYSPTLIYVTLGILANLMFDWRTTVAFGVTGVLWAIGPMITSLRKMTGGKTTASTILATICGALLLLGWSILGGV